MRLNKVLTSDSSCPLPNVIIYRLFGSKTKDKMTVGPAEHVAEFLRFIICIRFDPVYHCCN